MGICASSDKGLSAEEIAARRLEQKRNEAIQQRNEQQFNKEREIKKLLLLGAGESGKSTLFKQLVTIYGKGYDENDRKSYISVIWNNTISAIKTLVKYSDELDDPECRIDPALQASKDYILKLSADAEFTRAEAEHIKVLWADSGVRHTFSLRARFQLFDSADYFLDMVDTLCQPGWIPSEKDILRARVRTTGIVETSFVLQKNEFKMYDVGGQRNERKKWIHCFDGVTAVLFVAAISEYDQVLFEDEDKNRLEEAVTLFRQVLDMEWFQKTSIILFLNKTDLFDKKIQVVPLHEWCPEFCYNPEIKDANLFQQGVEFMTDLFVRENTNPKRVVYAYPTNATDTNLVRTIFDSVRDIMIRKNIDDAGLMN